MKILLAVIVFLGLSVGAFYLVENRHDVELREENAELTQKLTEANKGAAKKIHDAKLLEEERVVEIIMLTFPEDKDKIEKLFPGVSERAAKNAELRKEKAETKDEKTNSKAG